MADEQVSEVLRERERELAEDDARGVSEITILPDGRVYVLGLSASVRAALDRCGPWRDRPWNPPEEHPE